MERWAGRVALVTGASAGIGAAIAKMLVIRGMKVVACARNITKIQEMASDLKEKKGIMFPVTCDVTKENEILAMFEDIKRQHGTLDVCINNAGVTQLDAQLLTGKTDVWRYMLDINVLAICICTREAIKLMRERGVDDGHVIHINSMSGHRTVNNADGHFYSATKYAVRALLEGHRNELRTLKSHIRVSEVSPGNVRTELLTRTYGSDDKARELYSRVKPMEAGDIASAVEYILAAPPHIQVHDILLRPTEQAL